MVAGMSAPDGGTARRLPLAPQRYGTIVVVGGGCYGAYYVRQLGRAARAGAIVAERVVVVDRDPACRVARDGWAAEPGEPGEPAAGGAPRDHDRSAALADHHRLPALVIEIAEWRAYFARWLDAAAAAPGAHAADAIVPSPLMPHLMYEWLLERARARWPGRRIETRPLPHAPPTPWERAAPDGTHYVSFATWMCPINCIEPARCPHTRGDRTWSMPVAVAEYARALGSAGDVLAEPVLLHCVHRAYGVGMFDVAEVLAGDAVVAGAGTAGPAAVLIGTMSHCHGALNVLHLG
jgi:hypothetical protein